MLGKQVAQYSAPVCFVNILLQYNSICSEDILDVFNKVCCRVAYHAALLEILSHLCDLKIVI